MDFVLWNLTTIVMLMTQFMIWMEKIFVESGNLIFLFVLILFLIFPGFFQSKS